MSTVPFPILGAQALAACLLGRLWLVTYRKIHETEELEMRRVAVDHVIIGA